LTSSASLTGVSLAALMSGAFRAPDTPRLSSASPTPGLKLVGTGCSLYLQVAGGVMADQGDALYMDVVARLRKAIADGVYPPGSRLPSQHVLSQEYGVSRNTVRRALEVLREDGLMASQQGARRTVLALPRLQSFGEFRSFSRWARSIGEVP